MLFASRVVRHMTDVAALYAYEGTEAVQALILGAHRRHTRFNRKRFNPSNLVRKRPSRMAVSDLPPFAPRKAIL